MVFNFFVSLTFHEENVMKYIVDLFSRQMHVLFITFANVGISGKDIMEMIY